MIILFAPMNNATVMQKRWRERSCNTSVIHIVHELCSNYICTHIRNVQHFRILHIYILHSSCTICMTLLLQERSLHLFCITVALFIGANRIIIPALYHNIQTHPSATQLGYYPLYCKKMYYRYTASFIHQKVKHSNKLL